MPAETIPPSLRMWRRDQRLRQLGYSSYWQYIDSPAWRSVRAHYRNSGLPQDCKLCGATEKIVLHHRTYDRVGEEELTDLAPLCFSCHSMVHQLERVCGEIDIATFDMLADPERAAETRAQLEEKARMLAAEWEATRPPFRRGPPKLRGKGKYQVPRGGRPRPIVE